MAFEFTEMIATLARPAMLVQVQIDLWAFVVVLGLGVALLLVGVYCLSVVASVLRDNFERRKWLETPGSFSGSFMVDNPPEWHPDFGIVVSQATFVNYTYEVAGATYRATDLSSNATWLRDGTPVKVVADDSNALAPLKVPDGSVLKVFYNPLNPKEASLHRKESWHPDYLGLGVGSIFFGIYFSYLVFGVPFR